MLGQAALATCLRALNAMDLPGGPAPAWASEPPEGLPRTEEMFLIQEMIANYPRKSEIAFRGEDECRVQVFNVGTPVPAHEILLRLVNKTTVNVFRISFSYGPRTVMNKDMNLDDFLFYLRWCLLVDNNGDILRTDEYAQLKWIHDSCAHGDRLMFYTCAKHHRALPANTVHFCIRNRCDGWITHFRMTMPTTRENIQIVQVDSTNNNAFVQSYTTRSDMLAFIMDTANYSSEPQARGAGFADMLREPSKHPVAP